nr:MAG: ORF1 [Torque teno midi virus]
MPFFRYNWYRQWRRPRKYRAYWRRRKRPHRWPRRRRARKAFRRPRYGRRKTTRRVRRKKKFLKLIQWQPQNIRRCKIIGYENFISFGQGRQAYNFTQHVLDLCNQNESWGGGFAIAVYSLEYLFEKLQLYRNIWTATNDGYDLCRYLGCKLTVIRHPTCDFILMYNRSPPMTINKLSYPSTHPSRLLLQRKVIYVPSLKTKPYGKRTVTKKIAPPKLITNRWFFQEEIAKTPILMLLGSAVDFNSPYLSNNTDNNCIGINILNPEIFNSVGFDLTSYPTLKKIYYATKSGTTYTMAQITELGYNSKSFFYSPYLQGTTPVYVYKSETTPALTGITEDKIGPDKDWIPTPLIKQLRYQPNRDTGKDNVIFIDYTTTREIDIPSNENYKLENLPLWMIVFGFLDYMSKLHYTDNIYTSASVAIKSKFVYGFDFLFDHTKPFLPVSTDFIRGKSDYGSPPILLRKNMWIPVAKHQRSVLNDIAICGPFIANPPGKGFDLAIKYRFYWKWGGNIMTQKNIIDPSKQSSYPYPRDLLSSIQVKDPKGKAIQTQFHTWEYRRGMLTKQAIKRAMQDTDIEDSCSTDSEGHQVKRRRTGEPDICLQESSSILQAQQSSEEDSCQEEEEDSTQQHLKLLEQQQQLQLHLLKCIKKLQQKQRYMSLLTGNIN